MRPEGGDLLGELLQQSLAALFCALGVAFTVWTAAQALLRLWRAPREKCIALIPVARDAPALEQTVAGAEHATVCGRGFDRILIADCGLSEEARRRADLLLRENPRIVLCTMDGAEEQIQRENGRI